MQGNSLLESYKGIDLSHLIEESAERDIFSEAVEPIQEQLEEKKNEYYSCGDHAKKTQLKEDIKNLIIQQLGTKGIDLDLSDIDVAGNTHFFLWHTWFADVFKRPSDCNGKPGFDIVIGNPPYVVIPKDNPYAKYQTKGCLELYAIFFELAINILRENGILSFITGALYLKGLKFSSLRKFLEMESDLIAFRNEGDTVFKNVNMPTATILLRRRTENSWSFDELIKKGDSILEKIGGGVSLEKMSLIQRGLEVGRDKVSDDGGIPFITGTDVEKYCYKRIRQITPAVKKEFAKDERFYNGERVLLRETGAQLMAVYMLLQSKPLFGDYRGSSF